MSTSGPVVAAIQLNSQSEPEQNLEVVRRLVAEAAEAGADLILLPENFAYFGSEAGRRAVAERLGDRGAPIQGCLVDLVERHRVHLIAGGMPEQNDAGPPFNTSLVLSPGEPCRGFYRKIHLFDVELSGGQSFKESSGASAGSDVRVVRLEALRAMGNGASELCVGLSICYDLRFPELYRALVDQGAQLLTVPAAFTEQTGLAHWELLLRARAVECQCFVLAAGQWGEHPGGRRSFGHSMIVDPWGEILAQRAEGEGVVLATLDLDRLAEIRERLPALRHRRL